MAIVKKNVSCETLACHIEEKPAKARRVKAYKTNDFDVRAAIVRRLLAEGVPRGDIRHELTLNTSSSGGRADIVVLRDQYIGGIEIKSGRDILDRCADQGDTYGRAFDCMMYVMDKKHVPAMADKDYYFRGRTIFYCHEKSDFFGMERKILNTRRCEKGYVTAEYSHEVNYKNRIAMLYSFATDWSGRHGCPNHVLGMAELLWRDEAARAAAAGGMGYAQASKGTRGHFIDIFHERMSLAALRPLVIAELRARPLSSWELSFWKKFDQEAENVGKQ